MKDVTIPGVVYAAGPNGLSPIGETRGPLDIGFEPQIPVPDLPFGRLAGLTVSVTVDISDFMAKVTEAWRWFHDLHRACYPRRHRRCHTCHPKWSRPLAVNGHEYHRRQLARRSRRLPKSACPHPKGWNLWSRSLRGFSTGPRYSR